MLDVNIVGGERWTWCLATDAIRGKALVIRTVVPWVRFIPFSNGRRIFVVEVSKSLTGSSRIRKSALTARALARSTRRL